MCPDVAYLLDVNPVSGRIINRFEPDRLDLTPLNYQGDPDFCRGFVCLNDDCHKPKLAYDNHDMSREECDDGVDRENYFVPVNPSRYSLFACRSYESLSLSLSSLDLDRNKEY
jgi:hypothetical protein